MPVIATERTARQTHLHDVVKLAVASVDFDLAVCVASRRRHRYAGDLLAPAEFDEGKRFASYGGWSSVSNRTPGIDREAVGDLPGVLEIHAFAV